MFDILSDTTPVQDGLFRIHQNGDIYRVPHHKKHDQHWVKCTQTLSKPRGTYALLSVSTKAHGVQKKFYAHRLYAEAFIDNDDPDNKTYVLARDHDNTHLSVDNLYWATQDEHIAQLKAAREAWLTSLSPHCNTCKQPFATTLGYTKCYPCRMEEQSRITQQATLEKTRHELKLIDVDALSNRDADFVDLRRSGATYREIADIHHTTLTIVYRAVNKAILNAARAARKD